MNLRHSVAGLVFINLCIAAHADAGVYDAETTDLVAAYAADIELEDIDNDGVITDMDFSVWVVDRVFSRYMPDYNCDDSTDTIDGILALSVELAGLSADFDDNDSVDDDDLMVVIDKLGSSASGAGEGDLTGDNIVSADDVAAATMKVGQPPVFDPIVVAVALLQPLVAIDPSEIPSQLPGNDPCVDPDLCGNATCKARCYLGDTGVRWTYRLFMIGFCGSQFEADRCCDDATVAACGCSPDEFTLSCWVHAQGTYVACLLAIP